jgi:hypothetical protein
MSGEDLVATLRALSDAYVVKSRQQVVEETMAGFLRSLQYQAKATGWYKHTLILRFDNEDYFPGLETIVEELFALKKMPLKVTSKSATHVMWAASWAREEIPKNKDE